MIDYKMTELKESEFIDNKINTLRREIDAKLYEVAELMSIQGNDELILKMRWKLYHELEEKLPKSMGRLRPTMIEKRKMMIQDANKSLMEFDKTYALSKPMELKYFYF